MKQDSNSITDFNKKAEKYKEIWKKGQEHNKEKNKRENQWDAYKTCDEFYAGVLTKC